jgi:AcrR family transcriptional regulator
MQGQSERCERKDKQRNLERVLQAARELVAERGGAVTMEDVASRAGVGVGTIYRRFRNKDELLATVSASACQDARHCVAEAADHAVTPLEKLWAIALAQHGQISRQAGLLHVAFEGDALAEAPQLPSHQAELYGSLQVMLQQVLSEGQRHGDVRQGDPAVLAALCLELLSPRTYRRIHVLLGGSPEHTAEQIALFLVGGVRGHTK